MARTIPCDSEDGKPATYMLHNTETGDVAAICADCWPGFIQYLADAMRPGPQEVPPGEAEAAAAAAGEGEAGRTPARPKRRRTGHESASGGLTSPDSPFPDPTPIDG